MKRIVATPWYGGKSKGAIFDFIPKLLEYNNTYCEPFSGAATILLNRPCSIREILNDADRNVVNFFQMLRDRGPELIELCQRTPFAQDEYSRCKIAFEDGIEDPLERARAWYVLAAQGRAGEFGHRWKSCVRSEAQFANRVDDSFDVVTNRLRRVTITNMDGVELMRQIDGPEVTFYVDPPYPAETRGPVGKYRVDTTDDLHTRLLETVTATEFEAQCTISTYDTPLYRDALGAWHRYELEVTAHSADGHGETKKRIETVYCNRLPQRHSLSLF